MKKAALLVVAAAAMAVAGCSGSGSGSTSGSGGSSGSSSGGSWGGSSAPATTTSAVSPLAASVTTGTGSWGVLVMGGSAASEDNFWQLFTRPAGSATWSLVTPSGVADNGGLVIAPTGGKSAVVGVRPSQDLVFSPLAMTADEGKAWTPGLLDAGLADVADALAVAPGGPEFALLSNGTIDRAASARATESGSGWSKLATGPSVAASAAGQTCGLSSLDAISVAPSGELLAGGPCANPGVAGIFGYSGGTWHAAGPALPGVVGGVQAQVLRLTATATGNVALILAGPSLYAAWTSDGGAHWTLSAPLSVGAKQLSSAAVDTDGAVGALLSGGAAATISGPGASWQSLPATPADTAVLAFVPSAGGRASSGKAAGGKASGDRASGGRASGGDQVQALAAQAAKLTVWQLDSSTGKWASTQKIAVPIQYGSSS